MSFPDYLKKGQVIDLEIEISGKRPKYMSKVEDISDTTLTIRILEDDFNINDISTGTKGTVWGKRGGLKYSLNAEIESIENSSVIKLKYIPSRSNLRVDAFIIFQYNKITEEKFLEKRIKYIQHMTTDSESYAFAPSRYISEDVETQTNIPPEIISELNSINRKLDFIIKHLEKSGEENIFNREPEEVNISGSGIRFKSNEDFKAGEFLDIKLVLPISSGIIIELIGQVVRCNSLSEKAADSDEKLNEVAVEFAAINEDDREFIIRYVFKRQRELLRAEEDSSSYV